MRCDPCRWKHWSKVGGANLISAGDRAGRIDPQSRRAAQNCRHIADYLRSIPNQIAGVDGRCRPFRISHLRPGLGSRIVEKKLVKNRREKSARLAAGLLSRAGVCISLKAEPVP